MNEGGGAKTKLRAMTLAEVGAYVAWLDGQITRYETRRLELRGENRVERAAEQECYRTALQEARAQFLVVTSLAPSGDL